MCVSLARLRYPKPDHKTPEWKQGENADHVSWISGPLGEPTWKPQGKPTQRLKQGGEKEWESLLLRPPRGPS